MQKADPRLLLLALKKLERLEQVAFGASEAFKRYLERSQDFTLEAAVEKLRELDPKAEVAFAPTYSDLQRIQPLFDEMVGLIEKADADGLPSLGEGNYYDVGFEFILPRVLIKASSSDKLPGSLVPFFGSFRGLSSVGALSALLEDAGFAECTRLLHLINEKAGELHFLFLNYSQMTFDGGFPKRADMFSNPLNRIKGLSQAGTRFLLNPFDEGAPCFWDNVPVDEEQALHSLALGINESASKQLLDRMVAVLDAERVSEPKRADYYLRGFSFAFPVVFSNAGVSDSGLKAFLDGYNSVRDLKFLRAFVERVGVEPAREALLRVSEEAMRLKKDFAAYSLALSGVRGERPFAGDIFDNPLAEIASIATEAASFLATGSTECSFLFAFFASNQEQFAQAFARDIKEGRLR